MVLDSDGLAKYAGFNPVAHKHVELALERDRRVVVSAITLAEVLRGRSQDAGIHRVLKKISIAEVTPEIGRRAGELLGATGLDGHRCAIDAVVAATALDQLRPVALLTSDPDDLTALLEENGVPKQERVAVFRV